MGERDRKDVNSMVDDSHESIADVITRYFYVSTLGTEKNGSHTFNTFDVQTTYGHPTVARLIELSREKFKGQLSVVLLSICEIPADDWEVFVSEQ